MIAESLFSICIIKIYFGTFFNKNKVSGIGVGLWGAYLLWQLIIQKYDLVPAYVNLVISVILTIMLAMILYQGNFLQKIAFSILINTIWLLSEFLTGYMIIICGEDYMVSKAFGAICSKIITLAICIMLKRFFEKETIVNLPQKYNILLLLIPTGSMYIIYNIFMLSVKINGTRIIEGAFASLILLLGLNTLIFKAYLLLSKEKELEKYNAVYAKQLEVCGRNINEREKIMLEFRNAKHDIKQHYTVLLKMLQNDMNDSAIQYLSKLLSLDPLEEMNFSNTQNIIVDSLVNVKLTIATDANIDIRYDIHIPQELPFSSADLSVLLGNLLDNAIEASLKIPIQQRSLKLFIRYENNILIITIVNSFDGKLKKDDSGRILTSKRNQINHGMGLNSVRKIAEKYHGNIVIEVDEHIFKVKVILCDLKEKLHGDS